MTMDETEKVIPQDANQPAPAPATEEEMVKKPEEAAPAVAPEAPQA